MANSSNSSNPFNPSSEQAHDLAIMIAAGVPSRIAITYFTPADSPEKEIQAIHDRWMKSKEVTEEIVRLQGGTFEDLSVEARIKLALDKTYTEMAWFLYFHNYAELEGAKKQKADTCRAALEAKLAGMAGKMNALEQFYSDLTSGVIKLSKVEAPQSV